jgi:hypothetical protein
VFVFAGTVSGFTQTLPQVRSEVDTTSIRIGEQIRFTVQVQADTTAQVIFPEGQTFSPLETVEAYKTDTTRREGRMELIKTYALTQFDSGAYLLPSQRIEIDGKGYFTDSLFVAVATVPVDTASQKMYDIKPMLEVGGRNWKWLRILGWLLLAALVIGGLLYRFVFRKKPLSEEEEQALLPPFDRAMLGLKKLEDSRYLIQDEFKQYYTELTDIVRSYLEEEVQITALESTTAELMDKMQMLRDAGRLNVEPETLRQFQNILETADLVKFARSKPPMKKAESDREAIENIVIKTREALPEPTEEELMEQEAYREAILAAKRRKRLRVGAVSMAGVLLLIGITTVSYYGLGTVRDALFGNPSKTLLESEWISSSYGYPPIILETPEVLYRKQFDLPAAAKAEIRDMDFFAYDNEKAHLSVLAQSTVFNDPKAEPDFEQSIEEVLQRLEQQGARNIITKQEAFSTASGVEGVRVYGSARFRVPGSNDSVNGEYSILVFGGQGFLQQVIITWEEGDRYSEAIVDRILKTLEVRTAV